MSSKRVRLVDVPCSPLELFVARLLLGGISAWALRLRASGELATFAGNYSPRDIAAAETSLLIAVRFRSRIVCEGVSP